MYDHDLFTYNSKIFTNLDNLLEQGKDKSLCNINRKKYIILIERNTIVKMSANK